MKSICLALFSPLVCDDNGRDKSFLDFFMAIFVD